MALIESYHKTDIQGQTWLLELYHVRERWEVWCWKVEMLDGKQGPPWGECEHHWDVSGVVTGYKDGNPNFPIREPFTEETAKAEFEKWRT